MLTDPQTTIRPEQAAARRARTHPVLARALLAGAVLAWLAAAAPAITIDGLSSPGEWSAAKVVLTDRNEPLIPDDYDLNQIRMDDGGHSLYVSLSVYGAKPALAAAGSARPYLNFYFNLYAGGGPVRRFGLTYNDGYGLPPGQVHLLEYGENCWNNLGAVPYAIDEIVEVGIPWSMLPADLTSGGPIGVQGLFFLYNVAPGDINGDGRVDVRDLATLAFNYRYAGAPDWSCGDVNLDGRVDVRDLAILASHYGYDAGEGAQFDIFDEYSYVERLMPLTNHTPEPLTMIGAFLGIGSLGMYLRKRTRAKAA